MIGVPAGATHDALGGSRKFISDFHVVISDSRLFISDFLDLISDSQLFISDFLAFLLFGRCMSIKFRSWVIKRES
ncbi:hypothetical protein [Lysinibacillus sp. CTST325]